MYSPSSNIPCVDSLTTTFIVFVDSRPCKSVAVYVNANVPLLTTFPLLTKLVSPLISNAIFPSSLSVALTNVDKSILSPTSKATSVPVNIGASLTKVT